MKISAIKILEGEAAPWWYGFAWGQYNEAAVVCYPVPLNFLARWVRNAWVWLRTTGYEHLTEQYDAGYKEGERFGAAKERERIKKNIEAEIAKMRQDFSPAKDNS